MLHPISHTNYDGGKKIMRYHEGSKRWSETTLQELMSSTANLGASFLERATIQLENDNTPSEKYMCFDKKKS
jgi:hypothetical protein